MSKHARTTGAPQLSDWIAPLVAWHDARPRAALTSVRGCLWVGLIGAVFFWMSNPLVFVPGFHLSLDKSLNWTLLIVLITSPWARIPRVPWPWIAFHVVTYVSLLWTIDPHLTNYTAMLYLKITLVALIIAANCEPRVVCWGMGLGGAVVVALSVYAYDQQMWGTSNAAIGGAEFTGVGTNENILAYTLSISLAAILAARAPRRLAFRTLWLLMLGVNAYGVFLAGSGTGFLATLGVLLAVLVVAVWPSLRGAPRRLVLLAVAVGALAVLAGTLITVVLGKQLSTLNGRSPFWVATVETSMNNRPVIGSGWGAVWQHPWSMVPPNPVAGEIYARSGIQLSHGHNLFLDLLPELGLLGLGLAVLILSYCMREAYRCGQHGGSADPAAGRLLLLVLVAVLVCGITEPMFTVPLGWWALALIAAVSRQRVVARSHPTEEPTASRSTSVTVPATMT